MISREQFLIKVEEIAAEEPGYQSGHYGQDHLCDCIGLIIGAIRRAGGQWRGLHGSNYAARSEVEYLREITKASDLKRGEAVFKAYEYNQGGYRLPDRYLPGGASHNGDLRDYYHIGVVISVTPLRIRHMTTPKPKLDTSLGKWSWHGWLRKIGDDSVKVTYQAKVFGGKLNMRTEPSVSSSRICQIPDGETVTVTEDLAGWSMVEYNGQTGYVVSQYLQEIRESDSETLTVSRAELMAVYDKIGDLLGLRG